MIIENESMIEGAAINGGILGNWNCILCGSCTKGSLHLIRLVCLFYFIFVFHFLLWILFNFYPLCAWGAQGEPRRIFKKNIVFCIFVFLLWFLLLKQTSIAIFAMTLPCSAVFYRYENVVKCKACVSSIRERADKNQQRSTNHDSLFAYLLFIGFIFIYLFLFFTNV